MMYNNKPGTGSTPVKGLLVGLCEKYNEASIFTVFYASYLMGTWRQRGGLR